MRFANNDGGRLLIGVKDNGVIAGVKNEEDIYVVEEAASLYCSPEIELRFTAFRVDGGLTVIRAEIEAAADRRPVMVCEADGRMRAYYRVADENIAAPDLMVRSWRGVIDRTAPASDRCASGNDAPTRAGISPPSRLPLMRPYRRGERSP